MADNLQIPQRRKGEKDFTANPSNGNTTPKGVDDLRDVSIDAIINVLIKRGLCSEAELLAEEDRLRAAPQISNKFEAQTTPISEFKPVQTFRERRRRREDDHNPLRRWAAKRVWSRRLGKLFFGWTWHRKKSD